MPPQRGWADDFLVVALTEFVGVLVVRAAPQEFLNVAAGAGRVTTPSIA